MTVLFPAEELPRFFLGLVLLGIGYEVTHEPECAFVSVSIGDSWNAWNLETPVERGIEGVAVDSAVTDLEGIHLVLLL